MMARVAMWIGIIMITLMMAVMPADAVGPAEDAARAQRIHCISMEEAIGMLRLQDYSGVAELKAGAELIAHLRIKHELECLGI